MAAASWSDLPEELIHLISKKLPDLRDFVRFRAVCRSWCSSAPLSDPPPQLPWLLELLPYSYLQKELRFQSLSTGEIGVIHVKESHQGKIYYGPCCGYPLIHDAKEQDSLVLFNPLTNDDISLPPLPPPSTMNLVFPLWNGTDPILNRNIALLVHGLYNCWAALHSGKTERIFRSSYYCDGMFFTIRGCKDTQVFDGTSRKLLYDIPSHDDWNVELMPHKDYLVELSGVIVRVRLHHCSFKNVEKSIFRIYKLKFEGRNGQPCWVKVSNIGDHMLFLDKYNGFSLKPTAGFKGNCIYFFFNAIGGAPYRYDIAAGRFERLSCPFERCFWFVPKLLHVTSLFAICIQGFN